ncbi:AmmeMemoRadiSam system protein B [Chloroherpeton thalassium]|nr:AmmeMemoRadiSam system protein B [Chloroherpeton thalassium]
MQFIREPQAMDLYPSDCGQQIFAFLKKYTPSTELPEKLIGAVVPHAAWKYSGKVAARTLHTLSERSSPDICVLLGADHIGLKKHTLLPDGTWKTPLGSLPIASELASALYSALPKILSNDMSAHELEHSLEVISPMIAYFWPKLSILPIIIVPNANALEIGNALVQLLKASGKTAIFVASTDLTHYGRFYGNAHAGTGEKALDWVQHNDKKMIECICNVKATEILKEAAENQNACGAGALTTLCAIAKAHEIQKGYLIEYTTSHGNEHPNFFQSGVGYAGVVF